MATSSSWSPRPAELHLAEVDIHVWRAFLDSEDARRLEKVLTEDERARASRFVFPRDRDRFISGRGILRSILGQYLRRPASTIELTYEPAGKPRLRRLDFDPPICFNVSHSQGLAVYAFSRECEVGIDVEAIRSSDKGEQLAERFFSGKELAELRSLPVEMRDQGFFLCWTRKEAYVKARGAGLGIPLDSFDVSLTPGRPEELASSDSHHWMLRSFGPAEGCVGAVVAEGKNWGRRLWDWDSASE